MREYDPEKLGTRVRDLRKARGLSQEELAESAGIAPKTLRDIELGRTEARIGAVIALAAALEVSIDFLALGLMMPQDENSMSFIMLREKEKEKGNDHSVHTGDAESCGVLPDGH